MKLLELSSLFSEKFPDIALSISKLANDESLQKNLSQAGSIGALISVGFTLFKKIRDLTRSPAELAFAIFIELIFESANESLPSNFKELSRNDLKSNLDLERVLILFIDNFTSHYYYLPGHPAALQFKKKIIEIMRKDERLEPQEIHKFIVNFNSTLLSKAETSSLEGLLENWKQKSIYDKLFKYLVYLGSLLDEINPVDDKTIGEYYIENKAVTVENNTWELSADEIPRFKNSWRIEDFINSNKKREFVGAEFGTGKTNFAKKIASDLAIKYLRGEHDIIPIYVPLRRKLNNIYNQESLEDVINIVRSLKVFLICDGLDEYDYDHNKLIYDILPKMFSDKNEVQTIFTTRLIPDLPSKVDFTGSTYIRLLPFDREQVNEFFSGSKYNIPDVAYDTLKEYGLDDTEIYKPLFCWMFAITYNNSDSQLSIRKAPTINIKRALFFQEVIHSIIEGKHKESPGGKDKQRLYMNEKKTLRKIAFLASVYKNDLSTNIIADSLKINEEDILQNPLFTTYFNFLSTKAKERKVEFFHKSFFEYLLAESFIEDFFSERAGNLSGYVPSNETILFFEGLLEIINKFDQSSGKNLPFSLPESLEGEPTVPVLKDKLLASAKECFDKEMVTFSDYQNLPSVKYENMWINKWISLFLINKIKSSLYIDRDKFFRLVKYTSNFIPEYLQRIENIDLSKSTIIGENIGSNSNLSNAQLPNSTLIGNFKGVRFVGTNLSLSKIEIKSKFQSVDFSGADLKLIENTKINDDSVFDAEFIACDFSGTKLMGAKLHNYHFKTCDFDDADFSDAELQSNFLACKLRSVKTSQNTNARRLTLWGKSYGEVHTKPLSNERRQLISIDLNNIDSSLKQIILRDNPNFPDT